MSESTAAKMAGDQVLALEVEKQAIMLVGWECVHNAEFRPLRRDSLCPSGASLVSTMPAPSGDTDAG